MRRFGAHEIAPREQKAESKTPLCRFTGFSTGQGTIGKDLFKEFLIDLSDVERVFDPTADIVADHEHR